MQPADRPIYERGCVRAGEDWLEGHLVPVASTCVSVMIMQVTDFFLIACSVVTSIFYLTSSFCSLFSDWVVYSILLPSSHTLEPFNFYLFVLYIFLVRNSM